MLKLCYFVGIALAPFASIQAQDATIVYRLGKDTVAVETFNRTAGRVAVHARR